MTQILSKETSLIIDWFGILVTRDFNSNKAFFKEAFVRVIYLQLLGDHHHFDPILYYSNPI
jgi:hypothetical protein